MAGAPSGLRERKKRRTRERILACARELFDAKGFAETTIPEIAEAAEVSPRTVSSYFPHKEELVFPARDELLEGLSAALESRGENEMATDALRAWLVDHFVEAAAHQGHDDELRAGDQPAHQWARELIDSDPELRAYERVLQEQAEDVIAAAVAVDLGLPADHHLPHMVAATTMAALDSLGREAKESSDPEQSKRLIEDAMQFVGAGVRELRGG